MPLYEYECRSCRSRFEARQKVTDEPISVCPSCSGAVRRVIHPVGIIFKGSGFYSTDNRKTASSATPATDSTDAAKSGDTKSATDGAKTDSTKSEAGAKSNGSAKPKESVSTSSSNATPSH